ncbi:hypothetical protein L210DRAFT_3439685 [Boletus edulis BED1]|uniref:Uncharacterized protein n=1 Tax=Boletus edulis BED1 TaxID=1328754 RepID=A0AAD4GK93_BOLED|nr:hypothetical protein L210DRAFT_3439685 [Boletus edulis BED1]
MGLFKKLFSISSKKSKKRSAVDPSSTGPSVQEHLKPSHVDDTEAAVSRLLRSSSGRCTAEPQIGLGLPPLPHPIDSVIPPPKSSSTTLASVSARSTYSVTIHSRTVHSRTEFPNAYPPMDVTLTPKRSLTDPARRRSKSVPITPRDKSRLLALRQDSSVASLLNHYDNEGHLDSALFSNTPSPRKEGRVQRHRTGSTLRQLLGHPSSREFKSSGVEGDISWAEKFLGETDGNSSVSSIGPQTPADTHFTHTYSIDDKTALSIECDTSAANHPTFSSLEVELSVSTDPDSTHPQAPNSPYGNSMSPQRASQIFGFLGDKKKALDGPVSRLPQLKTTTPHYRRFSAESSSNSDTKHSHIPLHRGYSTHIPQPTSPTQRHYSLASDASRSPLPQLEHEESAVLQPVITQHTGHSCCPRGPCSASKIPSRQTTNPVSVPCEVDDPYPVTEQSLPTQSVLGEKSNTDNKYSASVAAARPREMHSQIPKLRTPSGSSSSSMESKHDSAVSSPRRHPLCLQPAVQMKPSRSTEAELPTGIVFLGKENDGSRLPQPVTPIRLFGVHSHHLRELPSPASSSELSPVAQQMIANLRQERVHARQRERQAGRLGSSQSRIW